MFIINLISSFLNYFTLIERIENEETIPFGTCHGYGATKRVYIFLNALVVGYGL